MSENKKLELLDQYDDVTFALLMDEYAEEEGARLRKEFEEALAAGEVSDTSDSLDEKCLQMIHRDFAKKRGKENVRKIIRMTSKVAVAVMVFLGVVATTVFSIDAFRIPVLNFIFTHYEQYSSIQIDGNITNTVPVNESDFLMGYLPDGFYQVSHTSNDEMTFVSYENETGDSVQLLITVSEGIINMDTEDASYSEINLGYYTAVFLEKNGYRMVWYDESLGIMYDVRSEGIEKDIFIKLCEEVCNHYTAN